ncbi:MAG: hypothetical protein E7184_00255 [Erysipelotrichaceae bacterium]|nr:hypothetical protein [Erysipelotrichaceae bacterium]
MRFEDFTKEQQQAITQKGSNIIVSAGAGSGKTAVLTQRVLHFIEKEGYHLNEFLILTFTKLAASEMKERIRKALTEKNLEDALLVDTSDITTFDAYALSIVKRYHNILNVSPNVSIIDSNIISVKKRNIIKDIFEENYIKKDPIFIEMVSKFCLKDDDLLQDLVLKLHNAATLEINFDHYLNNFIDTFYNEEMIQEHLNYYLEIIKTERENILNIIEDLPNIPLTRNSEELLVDKIKEICEFLLENEDYDNLIISLKDASLPRQPSGLQDEEKNLFSELKKSFDKLKELLSSLPQSEKEFHEYFTNLFPYINTLIDFTKKLENTLWEYKSSNNIYEFQDIAKMALQLFENHEEIRLEIKNNLKMIMIDEYQDTSLIQEKFIQQISNNNVYMVGDIKQSIYRFRNAVSDIFKDKYQAYRNNENGVAIDLNKNFRSRKEVLDDINYIFKQIMTLNMGGADYRETHIIEYGNKDYIKKGMSSQNNNSTFLFYDTKDTNKIETEIEIIAKDIINKINNKYQVYDKDKKLLRPCTFSDFCILLDRGSSFETYVKIFNDHHIPLFVENDENISSNIVVLVFTNILKLVKCILNNDYNNKEFIHAFLSLARSFIYQYDDQTLYNICANNSFQNDRIIIDFKQIILANKDLPTYQLFLKLVLELNIYTSFISLGDVKKNESYLDAFLEIFKQMSELDYTIDDFITYLKHINEYNLKIVLPSLNDSIDSVKLMNIHKSKGLEFSLVYFAGLTKQYNREELKQKYGVSSKYGLYFPTFKEKENIIKTRNAEYEAYQDSSEKIRLFYVALTRTKEKMHFVIPTSLYKQKTYLINRHKAKELFQNHNTIEDIFSLFINKEINYETFILLVKKINFSLPLSFFKSLDKTSYTLEQLFLEISNEKNLLNKAEKLIRDLREEKITLEDFHSYLNEYPLLKYLIDKDHVLNQNRDIDSLFIDVMKYYTDPTIEELYYDWLNGKIADDLFFQKSEALIGNFSMHFYSVRDFNNIPWDDKFIKTRWDCIDLKGFLFKLFIKIENENEFKSIFEFLGYTVNLNAKLQSEKREDIDNFFYETLNIDSDLEPIEKDIILFEKYKFKDGKDPKEGPLKTLLNYYKTEQINLEKFTELLEIYDYETTIHFNTSTFEERQNLSFEDSIVEKGDTCSSKSSICFADLIFPFSQYSLFSQEYCDTEVTYPGLIFQENNERECYDLKELNIDFKQEYVSKASKDIDITSSLKNLEFGTKMHYFLELLDFTNPNYDFIDNDFYKNILIKFINSSLMKNIKEGDIYKELEFIDEESNTRGIIDLLVIYPNHIDIIDYKTKNIDDQGYEKQLKIYKDYISKIHKKPINTYLYSLLTGECKLVNH